ncbi:hypothetical protein [Catellatospora citrea]|uniref:Uncharacterized protein n=1 Tax=Catellatospora citrea TaxID=53366 RepID=A0A8J3KCD7_9ACTN|nr:hypothetical protein [Catellatospora citrea]RKE06258.1 hypothetical protein C8E86_1077 [Catellatospora citrea]GIG00597.1 hypothetical protein Cci01nite_56900 [Catellatospora citrea]
MLVHVRLPAQLGLWEFIAVLVTGLLLIIAVMTRDPSWFTTVAAALVGAAVASRTGRRGTGRKTSREGGDRA